MRLVGPFQAVSTAEVACQVADIVKAWATSAVVLVTSSVVDRGCSGRLASVVQVASSAVDNSGPLAVEVASLVAVSSGPLPLVVALVGQAASLQVVLTQADHTSQLA